GTRPRVRPWSPTRPARNDPAATPIMVSTAMRISVWYDVAGSVLPARELAISAPAATVPRPRKTQIARRLDREGPDVNRRTQSRKKPRKAAAGGSGRYTSEGNRAGQAVIREKANRPRMTATITGRPCRSRAAAPL